MKLSKLSISAIFMAAIATGMTTVSCSHIQENTRSSEAYHKNTLLRKPALFDADKTPHECVGSAGYRWCSRTGRCERPWELAKKKRFKNTEVAFSSFCQKK